MTISSAAGSCSSPTMTAIWMGPPSRPCNASTWSRPEAGGSSSSDLAGAARMAPLLLCADLDGHGPRRGRLVRAARAQTRMTHNNPRILDAAAFFARAAHAALHGMEPVAAMHRAAQADYVNLPAAQWLEQGLEFAATDTVAAVAHFGQSCHVDGAMRSVIQIVARHADDPPKAWWPTSWPGGDSAARGPAGGHAPGRGKRPGRPARGLVVRPGTPGRPGRLPGPPGLISRPPQFLSGWTMHKKLVSWLQWTIVSGVGAVHRVAPFWPLFY